MAYASAVQGGYGTGGSVIHHESSDHSVLVPDTELLFTGQFHRAGPDLVLTGRDGQHHLIPGYFASEHHPALVAPNGAHLSPDTVDLLAGSPTPGHYAQAQPTAPPDAIGKVEKVVGDVTVVRNGVAVALHVGDAVFKSDVVQTAASSSCGISFPDGTAINLVANTRMALNDYAYDANSNANGALFTLVEGTFAFVAGKVAHSGDMKIATPVATMGIRGTTGVVQEQPQTPATITAAAADHTYTFAVTPDFGTGITGMWDVFLTDANGVIQRDANGNPIVLVTVAQSGYVTYVTPQGLGQPPLVTTEPVTNAQYAFEQDLLQQLAQTLNLGNQQNNGNNGSSTPPPQELPNPSPELQEAPPTPIKINDVTGGPGGSAGSSPTEIFGSPPPIIPPSNVAIWSSSSSGDWDTAPDWNIKSVPGEPKFVEILSQVTVTISAPESASGLELAAAAVLIIIAGGSLTISSVIDNAGLIELSSLNSDPTLAIDGTVFLQDGGQIEMLGPTADNMIVGIPNTGATLVNVDNTISGSGTIGGGDLTLKNFGIINATGEIFVNTGNEVINGGLLEATSGGTLVLDDNVANSGGTIAASGNGSLVEINAVTISGGFLETNSGGSIQVVGGASIFDDLTITSGSEVQVNDGSSLTLEGTIDSSGVLTIVDGANLFLAGATVTGGTITDDGTIHVTANSTIDGNAVVDGDVGGLTVDGGVTLTLDDATLENLNVTNGGTLRIDGGDTLTLSKVSIAGGTITDAGNIDVTGDSTLSGGVSLDNGALTVESEVTLTLAGATIDGTTITDDGTIHVTANSTIDGNAVVDGDVGGLTVDGGVTLTLDDATLENLNVTNGGTLRIDGGDTLTLSKVSIAGGTITDAGNIDVTGDSTLSGGVSLDNGALTVESEVTLTLAGATIDGTTITDDGTIHVTANSTIDGNAVVDGDVGGLTVDGGVTLTLDDATLENLNVTNGGTLRIDGGDTLTLSKVSIAGGTITDAGNIDVTGDSTLSGGVSLDNGALTVESEVTLTLAGATIDGTTITDDGTIHVTANSTIDGNAVVDGDVGGLTVDGGVTLTLDDATLENLNVTNGGTLRIDGGDTLTLSKVSVAGGTITDAGNIDVTGDSTLSGGVSLDNGALTVESEVTLTLAGATIDGTTITDDGTIHVTANSTIDGNAVVDGDVGGLTVDGGVTLTLDDATLENLNVTNGGTLRIDGGDTLTLSKVSIAGGTITDAGNIDVTGDSTLSGGVSLDNGALTVESEVTLTLAGATIDGTTITDDGTIHVTANSTIDGNAVVDGDVGGLTVDGGVMLTLDDATLENLNVTNGGTLRIDGGDTLTLSKVSIAGGTITDAGNIDVTGDSTLSGGVSLDNGALTVESEVTLTLAGATIDGTTITDDGTIHVTANSTIDGNAVVDGDVGGLTVDGGVTLTLDDATLENLNVTNGGTLRIDGGDTLTLSKVSVAGGTLSIGCAGAIDIENGVSTLDGVSVTNNGTLQVDAGDITATLIVEDQTTISGGLVSIGSSGMLDVETGVAGSGHGATLDGVNVIDHGGIEVGGTSSGAILTLDDGTTIGGGGSLTIDACSSLQIESGGATLDDINVTNHGAIQVDVSDSSTMLRLDDDTAISGGSLSIGNAGVLDVETGADGSGHGATLDGVNVTDGGIIEVGVSTDAILTLGDGTTINGSGTLTINAGSTLDVDGGTTTIDLGGTITNNGTLEASCGGELDVASHVDNSWGMLEAKSGGKLDIECTISGGSATIQGGTLEFGGKSNVDVTFDNSHGYGQLTLDHAENFCGTITDFTGTCADSAHSDVIDLKDINFDSCGFHECYDAATGMLTVTDGTHTAYLKFDDFNGTFKFGSDGGSGTDIYDPPVTGSKDAPSTTPATTTTSVGSDHTAVPADQNGSGSDHGVTSAPGTPPTLAENSFGASGNDSFTFHPNLGNDRAHDTGIQTIELAHGNIQGAASALAPIAPEFHQEFAFDAIHQDAGNLAAIVDQFHQMATGSVLLH